MYILSILFAMFISSVFALFYIRIYSKFFELRKYYYIGFTIFLLTVFIQFITVLPFGLGVGYLGILSFITYPIALSLVYRTHFFNVAFLALNAILKIYVNFIFFAAMFALINQQQLTLTWIYNSDYYHLSQGLSYLVSLVLLIFFDDKLLSHKLKNFFSQHKNLLLIISIQFILILNTVWISATTESLPFRWYNIILMLLTFSVDGIYLLLRLFTANSNYFSIYKTHSDTLRKQLGFQLDHYKLHETQTSELLRFKHDYHKMLSSIYALLDSADTNTIKRIIKDSNDELKNIQVGFKKYSNNLVVDAILNDYQKRFSSIQAQFDAMLYLQVSFDLSDLNIIKLFYNILENAYESLLLIEDKSNRIIQIHSERVDAYLKLSFVNTMNPIKSNIDLTTNKKNKLEHGFGTSIIERVLKQHLGFSNRYTTTNNGLTLYHLEIFLPVNLD